MKTTDTTTAVSLIEDPRRTAFERDEAGWRASQRNWKIEALNFLANHPRKPANKLTRYDSSQHKCWSVGVLTTHILIRL
jgi:hypothetical protein